MIKIFNKGERWSSKVNFVDSNNVLLGYDIRQQCCEDADWFISDSPEREARTRELTPEEMDGWNFDTSYFKEFVGGKYL